MKSFFEVKEATIDIRPRSPAHRTLFWFLYGVDPARITPAVIAEVDWCLPHPFNPVFFGSALLTREGGYEPPR